MSKEHYDINRVLPQDNELAVLTVALHRVADALEGSQPKVTPIDETARDVLIAIRDYQTQLEEEHGPFLDRVREYFPEMQVDTCLNRLLSNLLYLVEHYGDAVYHLQYADPEHPGFMLRNDEEKSL